MFIELPTKDDRVSGGRRAYHPTDQNIVEIFTWMNFSKQNGEYLGKITTWQFAEYYDQKTGTKKLGVFLISVYSKYPGEEWFQHSSENYTVSTISNLVSDQHKRRIGEEGRSKTDLQRFDNIFLHPPKKEWLVDPDDQVIPGSHTSSLAR